MNSKKPTPSECLEALRALARPGSPDDQNKAFDTLSAYFNAVLDEEDRRAEQAKQLKAAQGQIRSLRSRLAKLEAASASRARAQRPTLIPRRGPAVPKDPVVSMIEAAERNTIHNVSK